MTIVESSTARQVEKELNRFLASKTGRGITIGEGWNENLTVGTLVKIKDDCLVTWLRGQTFMFLGWQRYYERSADWQWIDSWGWDNGTTTHLRTSHQLWLAAGSKIVLMDIGTSIQDKVILSNDQSAVSGHTKWVQSLGKRRTEDGSLILQDLTEEQVAFEEIAGYRTEKLRQAEDLDKLKRAWLNVALPRTGSTGKINYDYGKRIEGDNIPRFSSDLFTKHKEKIISWANWNPKWSPSNVILRNFNTFVQQEEFREDVRKWLIECEGGVDNLKDWTRWGKIVDYGKQNKDSGSDQKRLGAFKR